MNRILVTAALCLIGLSTTPAKADVKLPGIFGDHMVLQAGAKIPVWGKADVGEKVTVQVAGREASATADDKGKWRVVIDPIGASDEPVEMTVVGKNTVTFKDVLVGEVWLCSGQSNMGFSVARSTRGEAAIKAADRPAVRLFTVGRATPGERLEDVVGGRWEVCTPQNVGSFTAVGYFFGLHVQEKLDVPVGLINASWGGTRAEAWMPRASFDALNLPYEPAWTDQWLNPKPNPKAKKPVRPAVHQAPAALYNGMIAPIAGYAMRGAIWYQGEANTAHPAEYRRVLGSLITGWRAAWGQGDFPFLVVQLPNFVGRTRDWVTMRTSQAQVAKDLPHVGLAVTIDLGESNDIHPKDKQPVGRRLGLLAEKIAYGRDVEASGPVAKTAKAAGDTSVVTFDHAGDGLVGKDGEVRGFEIAGADGKYAAATAKAERDTVILSAPGVRSPVAVRYGWANDPVCTLFNRAGLPAAPFEIRSDTSR